jgi:hypothetical protein
MMIVVSRGQPSLTPIKLADDRFSWKVSLRGGILACCTDDGYELPVDMA